METWQAVGGLILIIFGGAGVIGGAVAVVRSASLKQTVDVMVIANNEMRAEITHDRAQNKEREIQCAKDIGELKGQIEMLQSGLLDRFLTEVKREVGNVLREELGPTNSG